MLICVDVEFLNIAFNVFYEFYPCFVLIMNR